MIRDSYPGDLGVVVTSPSGTQSVLLDVTGSANNAVSELLLTSEAFRGESSQGTWTIRVYDGAALDVGTISSASLTAYGAANTINDTYIFTGEYSDYDGLFGHLTTLTDTDGGIDAVNAAVLTSNSVINLNAGSSNSIDGVALAIAAGTLIENAYGGDGNDTMTGNSAANTLSGGRGNDILNGAAGNDVLNGGADSDQLFGGNDIDTLNGGTGNDVLDGGFGLDTLTGGAGNDIYYYSFGGDTIVEVGGEGTADLVRVLDNIDMGSSAGLQQVENANVYGTAGFTIYGNDLGNNIQGNALQNRLEGRLGNDILSGGGGNDRIIGGAGQDSLRGDAGRDTFSWFALSESGLTVATRDVLGDYTADAITRGNGTSDKLDFAVIDAQAGIAGNGTFSFIGSAAFTAEGQIRAFQSGSVTFVELNTSGTSGAEMAIQINGLKTLLAADFIL